MTELTRFLDTTGIIQKENCILLRKKKHNPQQAENTQQSGTGEPEVSVHLRGSVCKLQTEKVGYSIFLTLSCQQKTAHTLYQQTQINLSFREPP